MGVLGKVCDIWHRDSVCSSSFRIVVFLEFMWEWDSEKMIFWKKKVRFVFYILPARRIKLIDKWRCRNI